jgi:hypothetical protein
LKAKIHKGNNSSYYCDGDGDAYQSFH